LRPTSDITTGFEKSPCKAHRQAWNVRHRYSGHPRKELVNDFIVPPHLRDNKEIENESLKIIHIDEHDKADEGAGKSSFANLISHLMC
jgi:hypothetical protein